MSVKTKIKLDGAFWHLDWVDRQNLCGTCMQYFGRREVVAKGIYLEKINSDKVVKRSYHGTILKYCTKCGTIENEYGQLIPEK